MPQRGSGPAIPDLVTGIRSPARASGGVLLPGAVVPVPPQQAVVPDGVDHPVHREESGMPPRAGFFKIRVPGWQSLPVVLGFQFHDRLDVIAPTRDWARARSTPGCPPPLLGGGAAGWPAAMPSSSLR